MSPMIPVVPARVGPHAVALGRMRPLRPALAALLLLALAVTPVLGHAELVSSDPADGAVLDTAPTSVTLTFSDGLNQTRSNFQLSDGAGTLMGTGKAALDGDKVMTLTGLSLAPGTYSIKWVSVASDGDVLRGELGFSVSAATPAPTAEPSAGATTEPGAATATPTPAVGTVPPASPSAAPTPVDTGTTSADAGGSVLLPIVVALVIVAGIGAWVFRRSRTAG